MPSVDSHFAVLCAIIAEMERAERIHEWPEDKVHAAAIVGEEAGELLQAANDYVHEGKFDTSRMREEAIQTAATAVRFLKELQKEGIDRE